MTFRFKKNDYRSIIDITFISDIVFHLVAISTLIKAMTDVENVFDNDFFGDVVDSPKEGIEQHKKRECLKSVIDKGKVHLFRE